MFWPVCTILLALGLFALHFRWRAKLAAFERKARDRFAELTRSQQQAAAELETQQHALFDSMAEGLLLLDQHGRIELANRAFINLFGITGDVQSHTIIEALRLHELADLVDFLGTEKQVLGYEMRIVQPRERWLQVNGAAVFNSNGQRRGTVLVFHDLTRIKQLERTRQEFVANVSHELRTPLSLIKGYVETLLAGAKDDPQVAPRFLQTIDRNAERLNLLIEDLLTISELESGRVKLNLKPVRLKTLGAKITSDFMARAAAKGVQLIEELPDLEVMADADRVEQVLSNLLDNAIKYGRTQGVVSIGARTDDSRQVEISVRDDGPGIPPEAIERVFERFYRVDKARSREQGGTGLGLSIVKHIVQSHGGRVWAASEPGKSTTFYFTLPLAEIPALNSA